MREFRRGNWSLRVISRDGDSGSYDGVSQARGRRVRGLCSEGRLPSTSERSLCRQQRFFRSESLPEMNSHCLSGMNVVKSLAYNGRFSVGGFIRISQDQNETSSWKGKKVLSIEKAKVFPVSEGRTVTEDLRTCIERHSVRALAWMCVSSQHALRGAGDFQRRRSLTDKKGSLRWVGGRVRWWRLHQCSWSRVVDSKDC